MRYPTDESFFFSLFRQGWKQKYKKKTLTGLSSGRSIKMLIQWWGFPWEPKKFFFSLGTWIFWWWGLLHGSAELLLLGNIRLHFINSPSRVILSAWVKTLSSSLLSFAMKVLHSFSLLWTVTKEQFSLNYIFIFQRKVTWINGEYTEFKRNIGIVHRWSCDSATTPIAHCHYRLRGDVVAFY